MWKDPIVEEVRATWERLAEAHGLDIRKVMADAKAKQGKSGHPLVPFGKGKRSPRTKRRTAES